MVPDGRYRIEVSAEAGVEQVSRSARVVVDRTLGGVFVSPAVFSPDGDGRADALELGYELTRSATVRVQVRRSGEVLQLARNGSQTAGSHTLAWNGRVRGARLADGSASVVVRATTPLGTRRLDRPVELDTRSPVVRVLSLRMVEGAMRLRLRLSEPARLRIWHGRETWRDGGSFVVTRPAGEISIRRPFGARVVRIIATDDGLNRSGPVVYRRVPEDLTLESTSPLSTSLSLAADLDLEPPAPVDGDAEARLAVHEDAPPAQEVAGTQPFVDGVQPALAPAVVDLLEPEE